MALLLKLLIREKKRVIQYSMNEILGGSIEDHAIELRI